MNDWLDDLRYLATERQPGVLVTVAAVRGSAPREPGASMIVTARETRGTIGGGQLEYQCTRIAAGLLRDADPAERVRRRFPLGANCGQCCGGVVDVLFERIGNQAWLAELERLHGERIPVALVTPDDTTASRVLVTADGVFAGDAGSEPPAAVIAAARQVIEAQEHALCLEGFLLEPVVPSRFNIAVFGAGHVGAATVAVLANLDCRLRWIDSRRDVFPDTVPRNVVTVESAGPAGEVAALPAGTFFIVMTHSHPLDLEICAQVLRRGDAAYCGLIGSVPKRRRFERRLGKLGFTAAALEHLTCPIGVSGIRSKKPVDIAIAVAAELLRTRDAVAATKRDNAGVRRKSATNLRAI